MPLQMCKKATSHALTYHNIYLTLIAKKNKIYYGLLAGVQLQSSLLRDYLISFSALFQQII